MKKGKYQNAKKKKNDFISEIFQQEPHPCESWLHLFAIFQAEAK